MPVYRPVASFVKLMVDINNMHNMHFKNLDLNLLVVLDTLLAVRNVTRAAERLGLSQSALSHALARLRVALADPLFVRGPGGLKPTPRAEAMAAPLAQALAEVARAVSQPQAFVPGKSARRFRIATDDYLELVLLPKLLARVWREAPGINISVAPIGPALGRELAEGRIDAIISVEGVLGSLPGACMQRLFSERFVCAVRKGHPRVRKVLTLEAFIALPHALVAPRGRSGGIVDAALAKIGRRRRVAIEVPHFLVAPHIVRASDVVLTIGDRVAKLISDGLQLMPPPLELPGFDVALFWHERNNTDSAHQWFRKTLIEVAREV